MSKLTHVNQLLADFGRQLTLNDLSIGEETNSCLLVFEDDIVLNIEYDDVQERLVFSVYLGEIPDTGCEPLLRELLAANLYWHRTRGATLSLETGTNGIILAYAHTLVGLDTAALATIVENLVAEAESWRARIRERADGAQASNASQPAADGVNHAQIIFG
ncbi:type III secretion system chaperone [uncultured Thiohalocapsa sp.]|uniref:type III secretion system chaperone n=1 Tax=uncultured Thiohalocapsa sp. TaxID=768990 RepID=UPI0025E7648C|nr:type III secretion system chaperone [uncultured Thiohalocapsa sp.]